MYNKIKSLSEINDSQSKREFYEKISIIELKHVLKYIEKNYLPHSKEIQTFILIKLKHPERLNSNFHSKNKVKRNYKTRRWCQQCGERTPYNQIKKYEGVCKKCHALKTLE